MFQYVEMCIKGHLCTLSLFNTYSVLGNDENHNCSLTPLLFFFLSPVFLILVHLSVWTCIQPIYV